jgi:hypothetical protein
MEQLKTRKAAADHQILQFKNKVMRQDLKKMSHAVDHAISQISIESVECRRNKRVTSRYTELYKKAEYLLENLEKHITFGRLMGG